MMSTRRKFLAISACAAGAAAFLSTRQNRFEWKGIAFGSEISIIIHGDKKRAQAALFDIKKEIRSLEKTFSLFDPMSEISRLNESQITKNPSAKMRELLLVSKQIWKDSDGRFDPTVQNYWEALATKSPIQKRAHFGDVEIGNAIHLHGHKITLNGIAQGYAADQILKKLNLFGYDECLVNLGEFVAGSRSFHLKIEHANTMRTKGVTLQNSAIATSSATADSIAGQSHILSPTGNRPEWAGLSVIAKNAVLADGWSTGLMLIGAENIRALKLNELGILQVIGEQSDGEIIVF